MIRSTTPRPPSAFSIFIAAAIVAYALGLSGCIPLAITGVAATASVATDRRSTGAQLDDELIEDKTAVQVLERFKGNDVHVNVTSYNGNVLLTGEVRFHEGLAAGAQGLALVIAGHYATERCGVEDLAERVHARFPALSVWARPAWEPRCGSTRSRRASESSRTSSTIYPDGGLSAGRGASLTFTARCDLPR